MYSDIIEIRWSYFRLPGFKKLPNNKGYVPCEECFKEPELKDKCPHELRD